MRLLFSSLFLLALGQSPRALAQPQNSVTYSAESDWQRITFRSTKPRPTTTNVESGYKKAFSADFVTPRNGWKSGKQGDYQYTIGQGRYTIRRLNEQDTEPALSFVPLPANIDLNNAPYYTIKVDMVADSGRVPVGGLIFGVKDAKNYTSFTVDDQSEVQIIRVDNGNTSRDYMPGLSFLPGVSVNKNRNRLTIKRTGGLLRFYINDQEIRSSPYQVKSFSGNGIGMTTSGSAVTFQKLSVTIDR